MTLARRLFTAVTIVLVALVILAQTAHFGFMVGELAISWSLHLGALLLVLLPVLFLLRARRTLVAAAAAVPLAWWPWGLAWSAARLPLLEASPDATLLSANTFHHNPNIESAARSIERSGADVVALIEPDLRLFDLLPSYRTVVAHATGNKYGIAVLAKSHVDATTTRKIHHEQVPAPLMQADFRIGDEALRVFAIHVLAPTDREQQRQRHLQIEELMRQVETSTVPVAVLGDLNMVPASPLWRRVYRDGLLRRPAGRAPGTWPRQLGDAGIAIDYILCSPSISASEVEVVPLGRSDHRGVMTRIGW